jgi:MFS family permease
MLYLCLPSKSLINEFSGVTLMYPSTNSVTPTWGPMNALMGFSYELLNDSYAAGCAAFAIGGPLLVPFALKWGRRPVYVFSTAAQFAISIWTAKLQTTGDLIAVNTLNCLFGALAEIIVQMTVADMFFVHQRGRMNSFYIWFLNIGGSLAPLAAGYITVNQGWRWVWWWMTIFFGISFLVYVFMFEETKFSTTRIESDSQFPSSSNNEDSRIQELDTKIADAIVTSNFEEPAPVIVDHTIPLKTYRDRLALWSTSPGSFGKLFFHSYQPLVIFATIPAVFYISLVYSIINATITVMITVLSEYLYSPPYDFNSAQVGLMSLPPFIATLLSLLIVGPVSDWSILFLAKRNKGIYEPEMRLWVIAAFIPFVPAGLFMFGFGLANGSPWPVLAVGYGLMSFGCAPASAITLTYLADAYTDVRPTWLPVDRLLT